MHQTNRSNSPPSKSLPNNTPKTTTVTIIAEPKAISAKPTMNSALLAPKQLTIAPDSAQMAKKVREKLAKAGSGLERETQGQVYGFTFYALYKTTQEMEKLLEETNENVLAREFEPTSSSMKVQQLEACVMQVNTEGKEITQTFLMPATNGDALQPRIKTCDGPLTDEEIRKNRLRVGSPHVNSYRQLLVEELKAYQTAGKSVNLEGQELDSVQTIPYKNYPFVHPERVSTLLRVGPTQGQLVGVFVRVKPLPNGTVFNFFTRPCIAHPYGVTYGKGETFKEEMRRELICLANECEYETSDETYAPEQLDRGHKSVTWDSYAEKTKPVELPLGKDRNLVGHKSLLTLRKTNETERDEHLSVMPLHCDRDHLYFVPFYRDLDALIRRKGCDIFVVRDDKVVCAKLGLKEVEFRCLPVLNHSFTFEPAPLSINRMPEGMINQAPVLKNLINRYKHSPPISWKPKLNCRLNRLSCFCSRSFELHFFKDSQQFRTLLAFLDSGYRSQLFDYNSMVQIHHVNSMLNSIVQSNDKSNLVAKIFGFEYEIDDASYRVEYVPVDEAKRKKHLGAEEDDLEPKHKKTRV